MTSVTNPILKRSLEYTMPYQDGADDLCLLRLAQAGNADAYGSIYERFAPSIFRYLYAHLGNRLDAEDLTEEVFLKAWRGLPEYQEQGIPFRAFLYRIASNALIDHYRRRGHSGTHLSLDEIILADKEADPDKMVSTGLEHSELKNKLTQLRGEYRTVLAARFLSDLSPEETAITMQKSVGAVRVLQHRALIALRKLLETEKG